MTITREEVDVDGGSSLVTSFNLNKTTTATSGNLLVAAVNCRGNSSAFVTPTGWTLLDDWNNATGDLGGAWYYKESDGTESDIDFSWTTSGRPSAWIVEYSTDSGTLTFDTKKENEFNLASVTTSQNTGTATASQANGVAVALIAPRQGSNWSLVESYTNSFVERGKHGNFSRGGAILADLFYSSTGDYVTVGSTTDTGDEAFGAIALFYESGAVTDSSSSINYGTRSGLRYGL